MPPSAYEMNTIPRPEEPCLQNGSPNEDNQEVSIKQPTWYYRIVFGWWTLELLSLLIALGLFLGLWRLVYIYDQTSIDEFPSNGFFKSLPSTINLISTGMRITILMPVAAAMSQLKWIHAKNPHSVKEHQAIETASRGILGSVILLFSRNIMYVFCIFSEYVHCSLRHSMVCFILHFADLYIYLRRPVALGCVIMIGSLFLSTFNQNTVYVSTYRVDDRSHTDAKLPVARNFTDVYSYPENGAQPRLRASNTMLASIMYGWSYYENPDRSSITLYIPFQVNCPATICTWRSVYTLSARSKCSRIEWNNVDQSIVSLPGGSSFSMASRNSVPRSSKNYKNFDSRPILLYILAAGRVERNDTIQAAECIIYWTVQEIPETILDWRNKTGLDEEVIEPGLKKTVSSGDDKDIVMELESSTCSNSGKDNCPERFTVKMNANKGLQNTLRDIFNGNLTTKRDPDDQYTELLGQTWGESEHPLAKIMHFYVDNVAISIKNSIRSQSNGVEFVSGKLKYYEPLYIANWKYLLYPGCLIGLSVFFVLSAILWTQESQPWKSSIYPYFYVNGIQVGELNKNGALQGGAEMDRAAEDDLVDLKDHHDGQGRILRQVE